MRRDREGWGTESRRRFLWEKLGGVLEIGGAEVLGKEISDRELVHARASLLSVWFGQEDCWKYCFLEVFCSNSSRDA